MMKVAMLVPTLGDRAGGITTVVDALGETLAETGLRVGTFAPHRNGLSSWLDVDELVAQVRDFAPALVHTHGLWVGHSRAGALLKRRHGIGEVVSPHGMLDTWALRHSGLKKRIVWSLVERQHIERCGAVHALCESEARSVLDTGISAPIATIPNAITLPRGDVSEPPPWHGVFPNDSRVLLFLGRLHPKKGVLSLIEAWAQVRPDAEREGWRLALVGWDENNYGAVCNEAISSLGCASSCRWFGPAFGNKKAAAYAHSSAFVLPSLSEGLPMTILEAWAHRKPVLMTAACNLPEGFTAGAAYPISMDANELGGQLREFIFSPGASGRLATMGLKGRELVEQKFTWSRVGAQFQELYQWVLGGGTKPNFVEVRPVLKAR